MKNPKPYITACSWKIILKNIWQKILNFFRFLNYCHSMCNISKDDVITAGESAPRAFALTRNPHN